LFFLCKGYQVGGIALYGPAVYLVKSSPAVYPDIGPHLATARLLSMVSQNVIAKQKDTLAYQQLIPTTLHFQTLVT